MILRIDRGHVTISYNDGAVTVQGEGYVPIGSDRVDYSLYSGSAKWEPPKGNIPLEPKERAEVMAQIVSEFTRRGKKVEVL
jgi:hypothetical protein